MSKPRPPQTVIVQSGPSTCVYIKHPANISWPPTEVKDFSQQLSEDSASMQTMWWPSVEPWWLVSSGSGLSSKEVQVFWFTSGGKMEPEIDPWIGSESAVTWALHWTVSGHRELNWKTKLRVHKSIFALWSWPLGSVWVQRHGPHDLLVDTIVSRLILLVR